MGLYGILVVTAAPTATAGVETAPGTAYPAVAATATTAAIPAVTYDAEIPLAFGEIDPVQNNDCEHGGQYRRIQRDHRVVRPAGWLWQSQLRRAPQTCYPPAVNYTPLYYTINGVAFNKTNASGSLFPSYTGYDCAGCRHHRESVLVRMVNAGSRMHVPAIVGSQVAGATGATNPIVTGFKVIAEDGNPLPGVPKIKSEVFMAAGKIYDVMINGESTSGTTIAPYANALAVYDRELSLSGNATERDAGMLAYIGINGCCTAGSLRHRRVCGRGSPPGYLQRSGCGADAHRLRSIEGRDRQRHQRIWRNSSCSADQRNGDSERQRDIYVCSDRNRHLGLVHLLRERDGERDDVLVRYHRDRDTGCIEHRGQRHHLYCDHVQRDHGHVPGHQDPGRPGGLQGRGGPAPHR